MSADDLAVAEQFLAALAFGAKTGELDGVYDFLAADVEWVTPLRDLHSVGEVRDELASYSPRLTLDVEFEQDTFVDLGSGRISTQYREIYLTKKTGERAYEREHLIELIVRDGKIARYELRFAG